VVEGGRETKDKKRNGGTGGGGDILRLQDAAGVKDPNLGGKNSGDGGETRRGIFCDDNGLKASSPYERSSGDDQVPVNTVKTRVKNKALKRGKDREGKPELEVQGGFGDSKENGPGNRGRI